MAFWLAAVTNKEIKVKCFFFYRIVSNRGIIHNFFGRNIPPRAEKMPSKVFKLLQKNCYLLQQLKIIILELNDLTVLAYYTKIIIIHLSFGG